MEYKIYDTVEIPLEVEHDEIRNSVRWFLNGDENQFANFMIDCFSGKTNVKIAKKYDVPLLLVNNAMQMIEDNG